MVVLCRVGAEAWKLPLGDHLQDPLETVRGVRRHGVRFGNAHHPGDVFLPDVLDQEQLYRLPLAGAQQLPCGVQVLDVVEGVGDAVRPVNCVYVL
jgi:hypothetical protein